MPRAHAHAHAAAASRAGTEAAGDALQLSRVLDDSIVVLTTTTSRARPDQSRFPDFSDPFAGLLTSADWLVAGASASGRCRGRVEHGARSADHAPKAGGPGGQWPEDLGAASWRASARWLEGTCLSRRGNRKGEGIRSSSSRQLGAAKLLEYS